jgi:thiol-disulfide isomerase/thioredoxin
LQDIDLQAVRFQTEYVNAPCAPEFRGLTQASLQTKAVQAFALHFLLSLSLLSLNLASLGAALLPYSSARAATDLTPVATPAHLPIETLLSLDVLDRAGVTAADIRGRVVLVHFFATWCPSCRTELTSLQRLAERTANRPLTILAVDVAEVEPRIRRFLETHPLSFPILLDRERAAARAFAVDALPSTIILDEALMPRFAATGDVDWDQADVTRLLETLLATSAG